MVTRVSGTVTLAPRSGSVTSNATDGNITQGDSGITNITAPLVTLGTGTGGFVQFINSASNVGSYLNASGAYYGEVGSALANSTVDQTEYSTTDERKLAGAYFAGGVGIEQDLAVGGFIYGRIAKANTSTTSSNVVIQTTNASGSYYPLFVSAEGLITQGTALFADNTNKDNVSGDGGLIYNPALGLLTTEQLLVDSTVTSVSPDTGALVVGGGVGIGQDINIAGNIFTSIDNLNSIGNEDRTWASGYLQNVYTKFLGNTNSNITMSPNNGITIPDTGNGGIVDIFGDLRVRGQNPIGTAPVVTNVLYVTMDGDDTNDGRAQDASRACRTISGAVKSPYYQPGTQIRVSAGHYLENNPIQLKPYTSIMGSDLRTTGIEPINKTQDLFHMNSGCYLAFMQFLNGRSGLLPGNYAPGYNRGAYATAFPPLTGNDRIDLFHSPYIQNCTNLSGPWLDDGTMFVPDETVQVPVAIGKGTWNAGTSTIVVNFENLPVNGFINAGPAGSANTEYSGNLQNTLNIVGSVPTPADLPTDPTPTILDAYTSTDTGALWVYTGAKSIELGMSIVPGQQNQGFFNARSLILANKPFLQSQIVSFIEQTFNSGTPFTIPSPSNCTRDVGLIIDVIGQDMLYGSSSDSTFAGLQYWSQDLGLTGNIAAELSATTSAIGQLQALVAGYTTYSTARVNILFSTILDILNNGPTGVTDNITVGGLPTTSADILADIASIQLHRTEMQDFIVNYVTNTLGFTAFNTDTCHRDVGYIIDSICNDLSTGGNLQSIKSGVYYYAYDSGSTVLVGNREKIATTAAYSFINSIIPKIVTNTIIASPYQTLEDQVTTDTPATTAEINALQKNIEVITSIITDGPSVANPKTPQNLTMVADVNVENAWTLLHLNRGFIQAEVNAFMAAVFGGTFPYDNKEISYRDTGILVENVAYDAAFGGNQKSIESGLAYWNGPVSYIATSLPQCTAAINYLNNLIQAIILNQPCPVLPPVAGIPSASQVINTVLVGGDVASSSIENSFNIITNIINLGPDAAPTSYTSPGPDAAYVSAEILMQANRKFIQENTLNYINWNLVYPQPTTYLPYNQIKCARDTGIIVDSIAADLLYPTDQYSQTTFAGLQYYAQGNYTGNIPAEITTTTKAISYLQQIAIKVIKNVTAADDAIIGVNRFSDATQITTIQPATAAEVNVLNTEFGIITSILKGNVTGWTDQVVANGKPSNLLSVQDAYNNLQANLSYMQEEVYAYITTSTNHGGLGFANFTTATCIRDIGYIIDSVGFDLLHGGNRQAIQSGLSYYQQNPADVLIPNQTTATSAAFAYLGSIIESIVTGTNYIPLQQKVPPVTNLPLASVVPNGIVNAVSTLTNIIANGPVGYEFTPINITASSDANIVKSYNIIEANRAFLVAETTAWINLTYNGVGSTFSYNTATCNRDVGLIVDVIGQDMLYGSSSDSTFTGLQYWNQDLGFTGNIPSEITATKAAIGYLQTLVAGYATNNTAQVNTLFGDILNILNNGPAGVTDTIVVGGLPSADTYILDDIASLQSNRSTMQTDVISWITSNYPSLTYNHSTCQRDVGYIIDSICNDLSTGGNLQSIKSGVYYYAYDSNSTAIPKEIPQTTTAYNFIKSILPKIVKGILITSPYQTAVTQYTSGTPGNDSEVSILQSKIDVITSIITSGPSAAGSKTPQNLTLSIDANVENAWNLLHANREFIQAEVLAYIDSTYSNGAFYYDQSYCYRDIGLMVDAVSQDIILGGNQRSIEAGLSYWNQGYNYIASEVSTTTAAISYIAEICQQIIANQPVAVVTGTNTKQVINTFFQYGDNYMPQQAVARNFNIISTIIADGPTSAPPVYAGSGLFALTGINGADVKLSPTVTYVSNISENTYLIGLSEPTVGFGNNATLYFGDTYVWPLQDAQVDALSLLQTGSKDTWDSRKVDPIGGMGGSLVDGAVVSDRSPIQSFVYDAFTQLTQGGRGIHITNDGYAQLVSVFTIFSSVGVQVDNGGIASIVNSNANFGDLCLVAKGYGTRKFSGTVYNPPYRAYPFSPVEQGSAGLDPYYPSGFWPNAQGQVEIFVPDLNNRPHISLVMEVVPPEIVYDTNTNTYIPYKNALGFLGFLNAQPSTSTLVAGTIALADIDTSNVYIGNSVHIVDQFGSPYDQFEYLHDEFGNYIDIDGNITTNPGDYISNPSYGIWYAATGTTVVDINFNSIVLNKALTSGGGFTDNPTYFTIYFCGNAYYTVQTSIIANQPYSTSTNILSENTNLFFQGPGTSQIAEHIDSINHLKDVVDQIINNGTVTPTTGNAESQIVLPTVTGGGEAQAFIDLRFGYLTGIIGAANINAAESVVPSSVITKTGTIPSGAGSAITLIQSNIDFMAAEVYAYVLQQYPGLINTSNYQYSKCRRDVGLILQQLIYDLETGGNYNMVYAGLSYWSRPGTYHIVELGEAVNDPTLFPDGAIVNFYQRSYISASGYVFEYVGAGSNYGALPQNGIADPIQKQETIQLDSGKVFFTSTDQNGDFRIGTNLVVSQATGVISGRVFTQSLFANMTPFILAIQG